MGDMYENQHTYFRDALAPGPNLALATQAFIDCLVVDVKDFSEQVKAAPEGKIQVGMMNWVRDRLAIPSTNAFMGPKLLQHDPDVINRLNKWEGDFVTFTLGLPRWMLKAAHDNRDQILNDFAWVGKDPEMLPWIARRIDMMAVRGMSGKDIGASVFTLWMAYVLPASLHPVANSCYSGCKLMQSRRRFGSFTISSPIRRMRRGSGKRWLLRSTTKTISSILIIWSTTVPSSIPCTGKPSDGPLEPPPCARSRRIQSSAEPSSTQVVW